jgi:hypothetical protein
MRFAFFAINPADARLQPLRAPGQLAARHDNVQRRDGSSHHFREHGREDQMIVSAENNYFRLHWQRAFEALRQSHSGKTAAHNHNPFGKVWRAGFSFFHVQVTVASPTTRHAENFIFLTRRNEWGEHPIKISTADECGLLASVSENFSSTRRPICKIISA